MGSRRAIYSYIAPRPRIWFVLGLRPRTNQILGLGAIQLYLALPDPIYTLHIALSGGYMPGYSPHIRINMNLKGLPTKGNLIYIYWSGLYLKKNIFKYRELYTPIQTSSPEINKFQQLSTMKILEQNITSVNSHPKRIYILYI